MSKGKNVSVRVNMPPHMASVLKWLKYKYSVSTSELVCQDLAGRVLKKVKQYKDEPPNYGVEWLAEPTEEQLEKLREDARFEREMREGG